MVSAAMPGDGRIGRYKLVKRLAVGGMADIWIAQEYGRRGYERTVVVKTIRADLTDDDELIQMLVEEARIAECLEHPNIVRLIEVGEERGTHFLVLEFVFGRDLRQIRDTCLERGVAIPYEHIVTMVTGVLDALHYAYHDATFEDRPLRVIHRDVSPQNILVGFDGTVKLVDFGIAKAAAQLSRTRAGVLKGKYGYMAPEQIDFKDLDQRADVFSTGIVLWEMLTQQRLFYRKKEYETVQAVLQCQVPFPRAVRRDVPWTLSWVAYRALRRGARWRYPDAARMAEALRAWDGRDAATAQDALAAWMSELYADRLARRDLALTRARPDPTHHRQIRDAGFELADDGEPLTPSRPARRSLSSDGRELGPLAVTGEVPAHVPVGVVGFVVSTLATWRWFLAMLAGLVFLGLATGIYIASVQGKDPDVGRLTVLSRTPDVEVVIGGHRVGRVPVRDVAVLPGRHRVEGILGESRQVVEIVVDAGERKTVELRLEIPSRLP
jgi:serine/threonine protein kinase